MSRFTGNDIADRKTDTILRTLSDVRNAQKSMEAYQKKVMEWDVPDMKQLGISDHYVLVDSFQKMESSKVDRGEYTFNFNPRGTTRDQNIGIRDDITRIIEVSVTSFTIPLIQNNKLRAADAGAEYAILGLTNNFAGYAAPDSSHVEDRTQQYAYQRITMFIQDLSAQSYIDSESARHHFEFDVSATGHASGSGHGNKLLMTPVDDTFILTDPINHIHGMTINFFNPDYPLKMPPDVIYGVKLYSITKHTGTSPGDNIIQIRFSEPTGQLDLLVGDRVYFKGFESCYINSSSTKIIHNHTLNKYINRQEGHILGDNPVANTTGSITVSNNLYTLYLDPKISTANLAGSDGSTAPANGEELISNTRVNMFIAKNRIRIPFRFRTLSKKYTNGIIAT
jgi:hypothetical protein